MLESILKDTQLTKEINRNSSILHLQAGTMVYTEGDPCKGVGLLISGLLRVYKVGQSGREITLYEVAPGQACILNVFCVLLGKNYPANAESIEDSEMLIIPDVSFKTLFKEHERFRQYIYDLISDRLLIMMELIDEIAFGRMDQRLWEYLEEKSSNGILRKTHQEIANDLGTSREVVSRLLKDFERKGLVQLSRGSIRLL